MPSFTRSFIIEALPRCPLKKMLPPPSVPILFLPSTPDHGAGAAGGPQAARGGRGGATGCGSQGGA